MKKIPQKYQIQNTTKSDRLSVKEIFWGLVSESPAYWDSDGLGTIKIWEDGGMKLYRKENYECCGGIAKITLDEFIRKYGEPHEIKAWFGEEREERKTVKDWISSIVESKPRETLLGNMCYSDKPATSVANAVHVGVRWQTSEKFSRDDLAALTTNGEAPEKHIFNVGDRVQIKEWDDMAKGFGVDSGGRIATAASFTKHMKHLCGRTATISSIHSCSVKLDKWSDTSGVLSWELTTDMIKPSRVTPKGETSKKEAPQKDFYPDWESLIPLPDKPRPWAKKGERYVCMMDNASFSGSIAGEFIEVRSTGSDNTIFIGSKSGDQGMGIRWENLAKIPGETYAEEPHGQGVPEEAKIGVIPPPQYKPEDVAFKKPKQTQTSASIRRKARLRRAIARTNKGLN